MKIIFDGKILIRKITGVERYAWEVLKEIDKHMGNRDFELVIPTEYEIIGIDSFRNIKVHCLKGFKNLILWEQISLTNYARKENGFLVSFDFVNFLLKPGISTIHDMSYLANSNFFTTTIKQRLVRLKLIIYGKITKKSKYPIFTVSEFQKKEIIKYYHINEKRIIVAGNAWQHFINIKEDESIFRKFGIKKGEYYFSLSSNTPNKNFKWIYETAILNPRANFVIVGGKTSITFDKIQKLKNVLYLGYQSDEIVKALYMNCICFIFPSFYEGFGIPPLEAISVGANVIVSNTSSLPEIFEDCASYIDPTAPTRDIKKIKKPLNNDKNKVLKKYSWENSANIWIDTLKNVGRWN